MRRIWRAAAAVVAAGVLLGPAAAASAQGAASSAQAAGGVRITGGHTTVATAPGVAAALISHDIVPVAVLPGVQGARINKSGVTVVFSFPVTGGRLNARRLQATIGHAGGILFLDPVTGKQIEVSSFVINVGERVLTAIVNGNPKARVPLLRLGLARVRVRAGRHDVIVSNIQLRLTKTAAAALDATFGTSLFTAGLDLGSADTLLRF
jgi:hypothetical protein